MEHNNDSCEPCNNCYTKARLGADKPCRCDECRNAHRIYERDRKRLRYRPDSDWDNALVSAKKVRKHIAFLRGEGLGIKRLSAVLDLAPVTINHIEDGTTKKVYRKTERKVLSVSGDPKWVYNPKEAENHLVFLMKHGISAPMVERRTGLKTQNLIDIRLGRKKRILRESHDLIMNLGTHMFEDKSPQIKSLAESREYVPANG